MIVSHETAYLTPLVAQAWNETKAKADAEFAACVTDHQQALQYRAEGVASTGVAQGAFELRFRELLDAPVEAGAPKLSAPVKEAPKGKSR